MTAARAPVLGEVRGPRRGAYLPPLDAEQVRHLGVTLVLTDGMAAWCCRSHISFIGHGHCLAANPSVGMMISINSPKLATW